MKKKKLKKLMAASITMITKVANNPYRVRTACEALSAMMINKFALVDDIQHLHERIDALEDELNSMTSADIAQWCKEHDIEDISEAQVLQNVYNRMVNHGATKEECDAFREVIHKYNATSVKWEEKNDGGYEE